METLQNKVDQIIRDNFDLLEVLKTEAPSVYENLYIHILNEIVVDKVKENNLNG